MRSFLFASFRGVGGMRPAAANRHGSHANTAASPAVSERRQASYFATTLTISRHLLE
ncbi:hypothetical protein FHR56_002920 [Xanthomonas sacchari]|nr:hypothetical protein [Xanthomonas sp. F10]